MLGPYELVDRSRQSNSLWWFWCLRWTAAIFPMSYYVVTKSCDAKLILQNHLGSKMSFDGFALSVFRTFSNGRQLRFDFCFGPWVPLVSETHFRLRRAMTFSAMHIHAGSRPVEPRLRVFGESSRHPLIHGGFESCCVTVIWAFPDMHLSWVMWTLARELLWKNSKVTRSRRSCRDWLLWMYFANNIEELAEDMQWYGVEYADIYTVRTKVMLVEPLLSSGWVDPHEQRLVSMQHLGRNALAGAVTHWPDKSYLCLLSLRTANPFPLESFCQHDSGQISSPGEYLLSFDSKTGW